MPLRSEPIRPVPDAPLEPFDAAADQAPSISDHPADEVGVTGWLMLLANSGTGEISNPPAPDERRPKDGSELSAPRRTMPAT